MIFSLGLQKNVLRAFLMSLFLIASFVFVQIPSTHAAPQYPPTIQAPVIGERILVPVAPRIRVDAIVVPIATSNTVPEVNGNVTTPLSQSPLRPNSPLVTPTRQIAVTSNFIVGGVSKSNLPNVPTAQVSSRKSTELQVPSDVPTRVTMTSLPKSSIASIRIVIGGKTLTLGVLQTDASGKLVLPPFTFTEKGKSAVVQIVIAGQTSRFTIRSTI